MMRNIILLALYINCFIVAISQQQISKGRISGSKPIYTSAPYIKITNARQDFIICNNENNKLSIAPQIDLSNNLGCTFGYLWSTSATTPSISILPTTTTTYTVTVTATNGTCTSTATATYTVAVNECCSGTATNDVVLSPDVTPGGVLPRVDETELSDAVTLVCPACVTSTPTSVTINDNGAGLGTIFINGRFVVAGQDVIFNNCNIRLGENAEIYVNNNNNLKFNKCDIRNACNTMWQGITAESNNAGIFFEGSNISLNHVEGAIRAVDLSNDANFEIAYTDFVNNFQNIRINNYAKTLRGRLHVTTNMQGYIYGCKFNSTLATMLAPHLNQTSLDDIQLANVPHILLGYADNNTNNAQFTNTFAGADVGIRSTNSELQVVNSNFNNMRGASIFPASNAAIRATSAYDCNDRTLTVGGNFANNVDRCTFVNSGFGIYTSGEMNVDVQNNIFGTVAVAGSGNSTADIFISLPGLKNVNITSNNKFYQFNRAIQINTSPQYATNIFIDNNIFDTYTRPVSEDQYFGTALLVINKGASVQKPKRNFSITNNTIINPRIGIAVLNHNYIHIGFDPVNNITAANTIQYNLTTAPVDYTAGMLLQNCGNARVVGNTIANSNTLTGITNFRGVDAELCADGRFNCNTITNFTRGFNFTGNCNLSKLRNNNMSGYEHAVHLEANATLPSQGDLDIGTGKFIPYNNQWTYAGTEPPNILKVFESNTPIAWYFKGAINNMNPFCPIPSSFFITSLQTTLPGNTDCADFSRYADRDSSIGKAVNGTLQFDADANENMYQAKMNARDALKSDSAMLHQGVANDYVYEDFVTAMDAGNMGKLDSINSMMNDSIGTLAAQNLNEAINDTNNVEYYLKTVNTLHMNYLSTGEISHADSTMFDDIAHTPLSIAGEAVYIAAAHIGVEIHQQFDGTARKANIINENKIQLSHNEVFMYPNPAFDKAYFHLVPLIDEQIVLVEIYDNTGNKIMVLPAPTAKIYEVDVRNLAAGIYSYKVICNTKIFSGSFSKSK